MKATSVESCLGAGLSRLPNLASEIVMAVGALILLGWAFDIRALIRLLPAMVSMNPVTAFTFILAGLSLWCLGGRHASSTEELQRLGYILAGLVTFVGALRLVDYLVPVNFHIDQLLFPRKLAHPGLYPPSEMAPNTALNFLLCGLGLLCFQKGRRHAFCPSQLFVLIAGLISLLALIGYSYRVLFFYRMGATLPMSLDTALAFTLFCVGFLTAQSDRGLMPLITSGTTGGTMARRLLPMAILVPWILGAVLLMLEQAGYFGRESAVSLFAVASILIFTGLIWWNARLLYVNDLARAQAERRLAAHHNDTRVLAEQLRLTSANLERSNTDLQQFAYVASHDLFEPLRMITSYLQLLSQRYQSELDPQAQEFIRFAVEGARRMDALIHELLAYSRVDIRGHAFEPVECQQAFDAAIANLKVAIEETGAVIAHGPLPRVLGDGVQLTQVFQNLLGNAIKFRGPRPPQIEVNAHGRDGEWLFLVRDNGIGIDPKFFDRIFVIFQRLHTREQYAGTGLGLAICKKIVERHGGRIWVESIPGAGSTFFFTLPFTREP